MQQFAKIPLPFTVETRFETIYLQIDEHIDLRAPVVQKELNNEPDLVFDVGSYI